MHSTPHGLGTGATRNVQSVAGKMKPETSVSRIEPDNMLLSFRTNAMGPILVCQRFTEMLAAASGSSGHTGSRSSSSGSSSGNAGQPAVVANMSARVGSIGDNGLGGWYSYRCATAHASHLHAECARATCPVFAESCLRHSRLLQPLLSLSGWLNIAHPTAFTRTGVHNLALARRASKAALNQLTKTLALEYKRRRMNIACVLLHPGTCNTGLSEPWQANVPEGKLFSRETGAAQLLEIIDGVTMEQSGDFMAWDKQRIPW